MPTLHDAVEIDRTEPGWLRRAWEAGRAKEPPPGRTFRGPNNGYLLAGDIPEILEPYIITQRRPGRTDFGTRILDFEHLDSPAATKLLAAQPPESLDQDSSGYAPPEAITLRVVADNPGTVVAGGFVVSPELPSERVNVRALTILDPALADVQPDVVPAELPTWLDELPADGYTKYLASRQGCLEHGITRQAWVTTVKQYGIREAQRFPRTRLITDDETGTRGVWFGW